MNAIYELLNLNNKVIIVYPIPEVGVNVMNKLFWNRHFYFDKDRNLKKYLTTDYQVFLTRTKKTFEIFDSINHSNLERVFLHKLFCDNTISNRYITHDNNYIYYKDDDHPSKKGSELINNLILKKL